MKKLLINGITVFGSKIVTMLISVLSLPLTLNYLGAERFGMLETIVSVVAFINFADLGIGFGLQNRINELKNGTKPNSLQSAISSVFYVLLIISSILLIFFYFLFPKLDWQYIFNVHSNLAIEESYKAIWFFCICFIFQIPFSVVQKIQIGELNGFISEIFKSVGNICGLISLLIVVHLNLGLPFLILAIYGSNSFFLIINFVFEFFFRQKHLKPKILLIDFQILSFLIKDGIVFFLLQFFYIILASSDRIIISHFISPMAVAVYSVGFRLATLFSTPVEAFTLPLLPALNDASENNDSSWITNVLVNGIKLIIAVSVTSGVLLILFGNAILRFWIGGNMELELNLLLAFGGYIVYSNFNSLLSYTMLTPKFILEILPIYIVSVSVAILAKVYLINNFGISAMLWSTIICMTLFYFIPCLKKLKRVNFI